MGMDWSRDCSSRWSSWIHYSAGQETQPTQRLWHLICVMGDPSELESHNPKNLASQLSWMPEELAEGFFSCRELQLTQVHEIRLHPLMRLYVLIRMLCEE